MSDAYLCLNPIAPVYVRKLAAQHAALGLFRALLATDSSANARIEVADQLESDQPAERATNVGSIPRCPYFTASTPNASGRRLIRVKPDSCRRRTTPLAMPWPDLLSRSPM